MLFRDITLIDDAYQVQEHQSIVTDGTTISYIGTNPPADYQGDVYDGRGKVAMPGFFNLHCHVPMVLLRGYGEGLPLHRWLHERVFPFEDTMTAEDMYWGALLGMAEMLRSGAVSFTDMYMEMESLCRAVEQVGMKANLSHGTNGFVSSTRFPDTNGWKGTQALLSYVKTADHDRIIADMGLHAEYTSHEQLVLEVADFARENQLRIHVHVSETQSEHDACKERRAGRTPLQWLEHCGVLQVPVTAAHCVWVEETDLEILARNNVTVAHCPSSNLKLGSGIAPIRRMLEKGVQVGIGTDGAASNNNLNMLEEITLASLLQKGANHDPLCMDPVQMLTLACRNGALAQGREDCGSIREGNRADLVIFDLEKPCTQPVYDTLSNILHAAQADAVCLTMVDGKVLYRDGEYTTLDIEKILYHAAQIKKQKLQMLTD